MGGKIGGRTNKQSKTEKINERCKGVQDSFQTREDHALNINLCI